MRRREQTTYETVHTKLRMQQDIRSWLGTTDFDFFVTANFNCATNNRSARTALSRWHALVDREALGPKWNMKPADQRTLFFAFAEHPNSNRHFHMMIRSAKAMAFVEIAQAAWGKVIPAGSMDIQFVDQQQDRLNTIYYSTKDIWKYDAMENFIVSTEFSTLT
jgi:hypothetical protein